jgi:hypothetical protein
MPEQATKKSKVPLIVLLCAGSLALLGAGTTLAIRGYRDAHSNKAIDESKLYIGIPALQESKPVDLVLSVTSTNGVQSKTYSSSDLKPLKGQDTDIAFLDYAAEPLISTNGATIGAWLADKANSITVNTVALGLITSASVSIDKSGVWFVNVASEDGGKPAVSQSYCYTEGALPWEVN